MNSVNPFDLVNQIASLLKASNYLRLTYVNNQGAELTSSLVIKDIIDESGILSLVLANGALIPIDKITNVEPISDGTYSHSKRNPITDFDISTYQLSAG